MFVQENGVTKAFCVDYIDRLGCACKSRDVTREHTSACLRKLGKAVGNPHLPKLGKAISVCQGRYKKVVTP